MVQQVTKGYKGRGVVLHTIKYGDSSVIAHLFTASHGRQSYMVQGVRSHKGRGSKAALLQPFFALEYEGIEPRGGALHRFREMQSGVVLRKTPFCVRRSTVALFCAEVIYRLVHEGEQNIGLFEFLWRGVESLDMIESGVANFHLWFLANMSRYLGFMPSGEWREGEWFDIAEGEYTHRPPAHTLSFEPSEAQLLSRLLTTEAAEIGAIELNRTQRVAMLESLLRYYGYHHDTIYKVESLRILREVF